ncbi:MAG: heavy-metal-associated domain-containing protein [Chloroflexota bacterium]
MEVQFMAHIEHLELTVGDQAIHCGGCETRIEQVLGREPAVRHVKADHTTQQVAVTVDTDRLDREGVRAKLDALGFRPT